jgi:hypothetical protein
MTERAIGAGFTPINHSIDEITCEGKALFVPRGGVIKMAKAEMNEQKQQKMCARLPRRQRVKCSNALNS